MLSRRIIVFLTPILIGILLEIFLWQLGWLSVLVPLMVIILFVGLKILVNSSIKNSEFWYFLCPPFFLLASGFCLELFLQNAIFRQLLIILLVLLLLLYLENIYLYYRLPAKYQPYSLENLSRNFNLFGFFMFAVVLYGFLVLVNIPIWVLAIILIVFSTLITRQSFWSNKIDSSVSWLNLMILNIILVEIFWVLAFLPISFYVNGFILTLIYYLLFEIFKDKLLDNTLDRKLIIRTIIIFIISLLAALISSRWI